MYVLSKKIKNIKFVLVKFSILKGEKILNIFHGPVFIMICTYATAKNRLPTNGMAASTRSGPIFLKCRGI